MLQDIMSLVKVKMDKNIKSLNDNFTSFIIDRVSPSVLKNIKIEYFGESVSIEQLSVMSVESGNVLLVKPFDKKNIPFICNKVVDLNLDLNPFVVDNYIRIVFPRLTYDKRIFYIKKVKEKGEVSKVSIRNIRRSVNNKIKSLLKECKISQTEERFYLAKIEKLTLEYISKIDNLIIKKEKSLLIV